MASVDNGCRLVFWVVLAVKVGFYFVFKLRDVRGRPVMAASAIAIAPSVTSMTSKEDVRPWSTLACPLQLVRLRGQNCPDP